MNMKSQEICISEVINLLYFFVYPKGNKEEKEVFCMLKKRLDTYFEQLIEEKRIPGCGLIVRKKGTEIYHNCLGMADIEEGRKLDDTTVFRMASMTKLIIAVAIMKLIEERKLSLNDNLVKFFPEYPEEKKRVRIRHLLNHSSSLGQTEKSNEYAEQVFDIHDTLEQRTAKWGNMPFDCELGESASYSALVNFDLLGRIIEVVTGENLDDWLKNNILHPLGMMSTGYFLSKEQMSNLAPCYIYENGKLIRQPEHNVLFDHVTTEYGYCSGAAGIFSTLKDYDRFTTMLAYGGKMNGVRILSEKSIEQMCTPYQITDKECQPGCPWGLGFMLFLKPERSKIFVAPGTFGWSGALGTHMFVHSDSGISATFTVSMGDLDGAESFISREIEKIVFEELA